MRDAFTGRPIGADLTNSAAKDRALNRFYRAYLRAPSIDATSPSACMGAFIAPSSKL
jgi:hypothetical protein